MCFSVLGGETEASKGEGMELESKQNPTSAEYFRLSGCVMGRLLGSLSICLWVQVCMWVPPFLLSHRGRNRSSVRNAVCSRSHGQKAVDQKVGFRLPELGTKLHKSDSETN